MTYGQYGYYFLPLAENLKKRYLYTYIFYNEALISYCQQTIQSSWNIPSYTNPIITDVTNIMYCEQTIQSSWSIP